MAKARTNHLGLWILWIAASGLLAAWLAHALTTAPDKTVFMPGPLTDGHHQLADRCDVCHGGAFGGGEVLQEKCVECHGDQRVKPLDSHPRSKFKDPRNADRLEKINALVCTTCHVEHKPEITAANGLTEPRDLCVHCHENVAEDRPSHEGMPMDTCATAGCHNFHNNRALYTDFLIKHLHEPAVLEEPELPTKDFAAVLEEIIEYPRDRYPVQPLSLADTDAPTPGPSEAHSDWLASA
ncbi:MAG: cytochrome c3 family protein, partial [Gammaproteobacteria bacterium]